MISKRKGRELALQCIYALEVGSDSYSLAEKSAAAGLSASIDDQKFGRMLVELVRHNRMSLEKKIEESVKNYDYERTALMDRLLMQLALAEIYYHPETPLKVVLSETMQLGAKYSTAESPKFINGILSGILHAEGLLKEEEKEET